MKGCLFNMAGLNKVSVDDINVKGKKVLVRVDFNVPLKDGVITNDNRIQAALPTIKKLIADGGKVVLCSHLGKPKNGPEDKFSLAPAAKRLAELVDTNVIFAKDDTVVGDNAKKAVAEMKDGEIVVLENTRFRGADETKNGENLAKELADLVDGEVFVMDAFGSAHRAHASTAGVTKFVKETAVGYLMQKEIKYLGNAVEVPERPFVAILGGAKVADKLNVISNLLEKCDTLIIGGGMAYTFLKAKGYEVGSSLVDMEKVDYCKEMMAKADSLGKKLLLPVDTAVTASFPDPIDAEISVEYVDSDKIPADKMGLDIGPKTQELFAEAAKTAKTVVWNGPMGVFENPVLAKGTIIAGNWKMNKTRPEAKELLEAIKPLVANADGKVEVIACVPFTNLETAINTTAGSNVKIGAENVHFEKSGAFTGEISADMLVELGVEYVVIGHSERRQYFGETDETVNKRTKAALAAGLKPIVCVGELLWERECNITEEVIARQIKLDLYDVSAEDVKKTVIAYEPVWAIGTGKTATADQAEEVCGFIRDTLAKIYDQATADAVTIQYGGSMNAGNAAELLSKPNVDGGLIGGASLKAADFNTIVQAAVEG